MSDPLGGSARGPGAPTINAKKYRWWAPWEAISEVRERPPSTLRVINGGPLGGGAEGLGAPTINVKKH
jgi:hypothetical protein